MSARYRIDTDLGTIYIETVTELIMGSGYTIDVEGKNLRSLELPTTVLLAVDEAVPHSLSEMTDVLSVRGVPLHLENANIIQDASGSTFRIIPSAAGTVMTLATAADGWFPKTDQDLIGLEFDEDNTDWVLSIGPESTGISSPVKAKWPSFNLLVAGDSAISLLAFTRSDDSLVVKFQAAQTLSGKHELLVYEDPNTRVIINNTGKDDFHPTDLVWTPRKGELKLTAAQQNVLIESAKVEFRCDVQIRQTNTALILIGREKISAVPGSDVVMGPPTVEVQLSKLRTVSVVTVVSPLWSLLPPDMPLLIGPLKGSLQTRLRDPRVTNDDFLAKNGELDSVIFTAQRGKASIWGADVIRRSEQRCKSLAVRFAKLGPGGLDDTVVKLHEMTYAILNSDGTGQLNAAAGTAVQGKYVSVSSDQLLALSAFGLVSVDTGKGMLRIESADAVVNWVGSAGRKPDLLDAWTVLKKLGGDPPSGDSEYRLDQLPLPGVTLQWNYELGQSQLVVTKGNAAAIDPATRPRLTGLGLERFRASIEPTDPTKLPESCFVAPFTLREHPQEFTIPKTCTPDTGVTDPAAFSELSMWEPASIIEIAPAGDVESVLAQIATPDFTGSIEFRNAGLAMAGKISGLSGATWIPNTPLPKLAPYKAIGVQTIKSTLTEDLISPCEKDLRAEFERGLDVKQSAQIAAAISSPDVPIALSPIGGSIDFDWSAQNVAPLAALKLHSYLARYEYNSAVLAYLLLPWGLEIEVVTRLFRNVAGQIQYVKKWRFVQPEQTYGANNPVRIYNLQPLNPTTWEQGLPFLFQADFDLVSGRLPASKRNVNLQGTAATPGKTDSEASVAFDDLPDASTPRNIFDDTLMTLRTITWISSGADLTQLEIDVKASGELVTTSNMTVDSKAVAVKVSGNLDANKASGLWLAKPVVDAPEFQATRATVGPGLLRVLPPGQGTNGGIETPGGNPIFAKGQKYSSNTVETSTQITAQYQIERDLDLADSGFFQLLYNDPSSIPSTARITGKLTIQFTFVYNKSNGDIVLDSKQTDTTCKFPDLTKLNDDLCTSTIQLTFGIHPKSFDADFTESDKTGNHYTATSVVDIGVPGLLAFRDSRFVLKDGTTSFTLGKFDLCPNSLTLVFQDLLDKVNLFGGSNLSLHTGWDAAGPEIGLSIDLLPAGMGGGIVTNLKFEIRLGLHIDGSSLGSGCAFAIFFNLGEYLHPDLSLLDWSNSGISMADLAQSILSQLRPVTLTIDPFVFRFTFILGIRKIRVSLPPEFGICVTADAGLGVAFDVGVASGGASLTLGARFCPDPTTGLVVAVGVTVDAWATVLEIIDIRIHAELFISLYLKCAPNFRMIGHIVFSGYASLKVAFVTISASFTVNLDDFLGLHPCSGRDLAQFPITGRMTMAAIHERVEKRVREFAYSCGVAA
jgi:hypothetical protein